jgi:hypothetical protein
VADSSLQQIGGLRNVRYERPKNDRLNNERLNNTRLNSEAYYLS